MYHSTFNLKQEAHDELQKYRSRHLLRKILHPFQKLELCSFNRAYNAYDSHNQVDSGLQLIPVENIVGSVSDNQNFDDQFNPRNAVSEKRWISLYIGFVEGSAIPPIDVYKIGENYFVEDGHHRVSVARAIGQLMIEARVISVQ